MTFNSTIKLKYGLCKGEDCKGRTDKQPLAHNRLVLCKYCNDKRKAISKPSKDSKPKKRVSIPKQSKKGSQTALKDRKFFQEIWEERPHYSEISGKFLGDEYNPVFFSHILTKAAYPKFRHLKENILLKTFDEHQIWEFSDPTTPKFKEKFKKALIRKGELIIEYYESKELGYLQSK